MVRTLNEFVMAGLDPGMTEERTAGLAFKDGIAWP
jgi:hypothetical protein